MKSQILLFAAMLTLAAPTTAQVVMNLDTAESFASIQLAIDDADTLDGHTLEMQVADHTTPDLQTVFSKSLTLQGTGPDILRPSFDTGTSGDTRGWFLIPLGKTVSFKNLIFDGTGSKVHTCLRNHGTLSVTDCRFTEIKFDESGPLYGGIAISHFGTGGAPMVVSDCTFDEIGRFGIHVFEPATIERCCYTGKGPGNWLDYFTCVDAFGASIGVATIDECTVSRNRGVALSDGSGSAGMLFTTFFGAGTDVTVTNSMITNNSTGIAVGFDAFDATVVSVSNTIIAGNDFGVVNTSASTISDLTGNWWGDASGPSDPSGTLEADNPPCFGASFTPAMDVINADGAGNSVTDGNVDYCSWLLTSPLAGELALTAADCQDDANAAAGFQVEIQVEMVNLTLKATGFQAFVDYPVATLLYRGDLSSYSSSPFPLHISPIMQTDDGRIELDGSEAFGGLGSVADAVLATLVFDVVTTCGPTVPASFEVAGAFPSELSFSGTPLTTTLTNAAAITLDDTPPVLTPCPADITQSADAGSCTGAVVTWADPTATDTCDPSPTVVCAPASGSTFGIGTTTVTCTATDACGNESSCTFDVTITPTNDVDIVVELTGSDATSRCIHFQTDSCSSIADVTLTFVSSAPATATATIQVPCGVWTQLCAKDEQHTKWDTTALTIVGAKYVATTTLVLDGGDTDNDGDVDINDVTWFLAQFGGITVSGGCPYDGLTRDADFSNNGAVGSEDYVFLTANWLTSSSCGCASVFGGGDRPGMHQWQPVHDAMTSAADLSGDGRVDVRDVELFELKYGLSGELSRRMRASQR